MKTWTTSQRIPKSFFPKTNLQTVPTGTGRYATNVGPQTGLRPFQIGLINVNLAKKCAWKPNDSNRRIANTTLNSNMQSNLRQEEWIGIVQKCPCNGTYEKSMTPIGKLRMTRWVQTVIDSSSEIWNALTSFEYPLNPPSSCTIILPHSLSRPNMNKYQTNRVEQTHILEQTL